MSNPNVVRIQGRLWELLKHDPEANYDDTVEALLRLVTFHMTFVCEECRKSMAHDLIERAPEMLAEANQFAAENPGPCICNTGAPTTRH